MSDLADGELDEMMAAAKHAMADVSTRLGAREPVAGHYVAEDMGAAEQRPPFAAPPPAR